MEDNGIKFFARGGAKLDDAVEQAIEERLGQEWKRPIGGDVGSISLSPKLRAEYISHVVSAAQSFAGADLPLEGLHVVVDAAHGAASEAGPAAMAAAGAKVTVINAEPDGRNINAGVGSTHLDGVAAAVRDARADLGVAFDGDADRCLAVDHDGQVVTGDHLLGILAHAMNDAGTLYRDTVVATVMSNLGFHRAMRSAGIEIVETAVGDRYVLEAMRAEGYTLGGEQSGHVIMSEYATTGDGILTALLVASRVASTGVTLKELCATIEALPQVLINVPDVDRTRVYSDEPLQQAVAEVRAELGDDGRVLLRPSGTEPLVRVMVEADTDKRARASAEKLAKVVAKRLALT